MSRGALIIGGGLAGIQAALDLANSGMTVHLVEPSPFLGHRDSFSMPRHLLNTRLLEVTKHPNVTVWTNARINRVDGEPGRYHVELRQHPRYVDLIKCTACGDCVAVCPVTMPGTDRAQTPSIRAIHLAENAQPGCAVIEKLGKAPCSNTCPGGIHVQGYVALIAQGRFREALDLIRQAIPFPGICGRICTHTCELNCRRAEVDAAVAIRLLKRFVVDWESQNLDDAVEEPISPPASNAKRVAVIGAGPAGLAVADNLVRRGYRVTVFEASPVVGGMMAMGIPSYRLPRDVIGSEVKRIERRGVEIYLNTPIGPEGKHTLDDLLDQGYDAIFIGVGAHQGHDLQIPGEHLRGVVSGIQLLKAVNLSHQTDDPRWQMKVLSYLLGGVATRVAIVGGGNTAMDVARSLRRLGVDDVRILYRRTRAEMPALPEEITETEYEGVPIEYLVAPVRILGNEQGRAVALECVRMKLGEPDHSGRRRPVPIAGSEFTLDVDMVVPAIGQSPDLSFLGEAHGFAITREGTFNIDRVSYMTNRPGVFAAGDAITQPVSVIDAIGSAKQAAAGIDAYLRGVPAQEVPVSARQVPIARRELLPEDLTPKPRHPSPTIPMARRMHSYAEVELGYDAETAIAEAQRCLMCGPCSECLACEAVCKPKAIIHEQSEHFQELEVGAIIWAHQTSDASADRRGLPTKLSGLCGENVDGRAGIHDVASDDPLAGSAAAAQVMIDLFAECSPAALPTPIGGNLRTPSAGAARIGVFICQCNGHISEVIDTAALETAAKAWNDVAHCQVLAQWCSAEAADALYQAVADHNLDRVVLAACSCCSEDQVCYSCTYQRVRCKDNLLGPNSLRHPRDRGNPSFEFLNIREQCAWVHGDDPQAATTAASAMVAAAVARARLSPLSKDSRLSQPARTILILGTGQAAAVCQGVLSAQQIQALWPRTTPHQIRQTQDHFTALLDTGSGGPEVPSGVGRFPDQVSTLSGTRTAWTGSALVLAPCNEQEFYQIKAAFEPAGRQPRIQRAWGGADTHRPGVFFCDPAVDPTISGMAAAARAAAWLGCEHPRAGATVYEVDPDRCRGCGDCEKICEFGAIQLQGEGEPRVAWIDPLICLGDGTCATRCPAGAIVTDRPTSEQIEAMLEAILV